MNDEQKSRPAKRVSNACIPCRSRHMRCDSATPVCSRCQTEGSRCVYIKSRRGGIRRGSSQSLPSPSQPQTGSHPQSQTSPQHQLHHHLQLQLPSGTITPTSLSSHSSLSYEPQGGALYPSIHPLYEGSAADATDNELLSLYYSYFHTAHPCTLPQWSLRVRAALQPESIELLMPVLQYIGSLFSSAVESAPLEAKVLDALNELRCAGRDLSPFDIQGLLLYLVVVYWCDEIQRALDLLDEVIEGAVKIGMNQAGFDTAHGEGDPVLEESWRRTWWTIYIIATHISGSTHTFPSKVDGIAVSVKLPCEEEFYEAGNIVSPLSIDDYEMREFHPSEACFSSFAELIGIARSLDLVLSERWQTGTEAANRVCANADTTILAWLLLLPAQKQSLLKQNGTVDQLLFRAHMLIYTYIVDLNRELSSLLHTSIESISRRSPRPPPLSRDLTWSPLNPTTTIHTTKVLTAIEKMNALLTLPTHLSLHTPFIICMISNTAIAHLAAYKWVYAGPRLAIERERIRLVVAVLKRLSSNWPLARRTYRDVVTIARDILGNEGGAAVVGFEGLAGLNLGSVGFMGEEGFGSEDLDVDVNKEGEGAEGSHSR
ncbi:hypothetical protein BJY01DRAFT_255689 [Aspergillus pseudoustus]|uniref:Zn(2)-C6 fungal-type domain-containing protein n=1 Tax=Aspergillus pseudoustus TaxID=1810923 RepID=A0ABR4II73_9EURO